MVVRTAVSFDSFVFRLPTHMSRLQMLGNLQNPPEPFQDVIRTHFRLKAKSISRQLDDWLAKDDGRGVATDGTVAVRAGPGSNSDSMARDVAELKKAFAKL